jgi:hypothetical protein
MKNPTIAETATTHAELTRKRNNAARLTAKIVRVFQSMMEALANCIATTAIRAREPAMTPSSAAEATGDLRKRGINGPLRATRKKPGRKIPRVATIAPL